MDRANDLLFRHLSPEQAQSLRDRCGFWVDAPSGRRYWLSESRYIGRQGQRVYHSYCFMTLDEQHNHLPLADYLLATKVMIESDEQLFLATAVHSANPINEPMSLIVALKRIVWGIGAMLLVALALAVAVAVLCFLFYCLGRFEDYMAPQWTMLYNPDYVDYIVVGLMSVVGGTILTILLGAICAGIWGLGGSVMRHGDDD